jgi:hypothetical protein
MPVQSDGSVWIRLSLDEAKILRLSMEMVLYHPYQFDTRLSKG